MGIDPPTIAGEPGGIAVEPTVRPAQPPSPGALSEDDPYAAIPAFYDAEFDGAEVDAAFFARHGESGPLLVLGCGSGRVCRLLECARPVVGLDRSCAMLARARSRAPTSYAAISLPHAGPGGTLYVQGDMRSFRLGAFSEVVAPNAAFAFLLTRRDRASCLEAVREALPPGGILWIDVPMPDFRYLGERHGRERPAWYGEVDGRPARRTRETFRCPEESLLVLVDRYYLDGSRAAESELRLHMALPSEMECTVESCGFWVDAMYGGYRDQPIGPGSERILVRAARS